MQYMLKAAKTIGIGAGCLAAVLVLAMMAFLPNYMPIPELRAQVVSNNGSSQTLCLGYVVYIVATAVATTVSGIGTCKLLDGLLAIGVNSSVIAIENRDLQDQILRLTKAAKTKEADFESRRQVQEQLLRDEINSTKTIVKSKEEELYAKNAMLIAKLDSLAAQLALREQQVVNLRLVAGGQKKAEDLLPKELSGNDEPNSSLTLLVC